MKRLIIALGIMASLALPVQALAHASLMSTDPTDGTLIAAAPSQITLTFNEEVQPVSLRLIDSLGHSDELTDIAVHGASLVVTAPRDRPDGTYLLSWRVISADGHPVGGSFAYSVGLTRGSNPVVQDDTGWAVRAAIWMSRVFVYLGLFIGVGTAFFASWLARETELPSSCRKIAAFALIAALFFLAFSIGLQGLDTVAASIEALAHPAVWIVGAKTTLGRSTAVSAIAILLALFALQRPSHWSHVASALALVCAGLSLALTGHAANAAPRAATVPAVFLHGVALVFWVGALLPLAGLFKSQDRTAIAPLLRFSRVAPAMIAVLMVSGSILAVIQLEHWNSLWTTSYGIVLSAKLTIVCAVLALAAYNRYSLTPDLVANTTGGAARLRRSITIELVLVLVILGLVATWRFTPPPRSLLAPSEMSSTHIHTERAMATVSISRREADLFDIAIFLQRPDEQVLKGKQLAVTLSQPASGIEAITRLASRDGEEQWHVRGLPLPVAGKWNLSLTILVDDFDEITIGGPVSIPK